MFLSVKRYKKDLLIVGKTLSGKENRQNSDIDLLTPAANVVFLPMIFLWVISLAIFILAEILHTSAGMLGDSFNVINSLLSGLALGAIALSLFLQRAELKTTIREMQDSTAALQQQAIYLKFERDRNVREFAATFQSERLKKARTNAFILRPAFFKNEDFRRMLADQWISGEYVSLSKEWIEYIQNTNEGRISANELSTVGDHTWHISDLIEYYSTLYSHCESLGSSESEAIAKILGEQYIWPYWRGMILLLAYEVARLYDEIVEESDEREQFPKPGWIRHLVLFDRWVMPDRYKPMIHPREKLYLERPIEFDDDYLNEFSGLSKPVNA